jgi:hypothetical protein
MEQSELIVLLDYDPLTGIFRRRVLWRGLDCPAGTSSHYGRRYICVKGRKYSASRLAWFYMTGTWPPQEIDHKNCDPSDDRFDNLRLATRGQNMRNLRRGSTNTSGFKGVCFDKARGKWLASISVGNRFKNLGRYDSAEAAHTAFIEASQRLAGQFARGG